MVIICIDWYGPSLHMINVVLRRYSYGQNGEWKEEEEQVSRQLGEINK